MKRFKKLLIAISGLALSVGAAVGVGLGVEKNANEAKAAASVTSVTLKGSFDSWGDGIAFTKVGSDWTLTKYLDKDVQFKILVKGGGDQWVGYNWGISDSNIDYGYIGNEGENFKTSSAQSFTFTVKETFYSNYGSDVTIKQIATRTVKKYRVNDGTPEASPFATEKYPNGTSYAKPDRINKTGYHYGGWFTNSECTSAYNGSTLNADLNLYIKYTTLVADSYVYYITGSSSPTTNNIYSFGGDEQFGAQKSIASFATEVHGVVNFQGVEQTIYKIPYSTTAGDTHIIFNNGSWGGDNQTSDMLLVSHSAYWWSKDADYHNDDAGASLDFILALEEKRTSVSASGSVKEDSVCGISVDDCISLCNAYNALTQTQRTTYVDCSLVWTYKRNGSEGNENTTIFVIMEQIAYQAGGVALNGHANSRYVPNTVASSSNNNSSVITVVASSIVALLAVGGYFYLRRKTDR